MVFKWPNEELVSPTPGLLRDLTLPTQPLLANFISKCLHTGTGISCIVETIFLITGKTCTKIKTCAWNLLYKFISDTCIIKLTNSPRPHQRNGILTSWTQKAESQKPSHYDNSIKTQKPHGCHHKTASSLTFPCPQRNMQMYFSPCAVETPVSNLCHWELLCCNSDFSSCMGRMLQGCPHLVSVMT